MDKQHKAMNLSKSIESVNDSGPEIIQNGSHTFQLLHVVWISPPQKQSEHLFD